MINPLLWLDLRVRVRERRLWAIAFFFLAIPMLITLLSITSSLDDGGNNEPGEVGTLTAMCAIFCQAGLLVILSPLAAAQRISQEREQRTYAALVNSPLSPATIARGKLWGAWIFTLWLGVLTLPFVAVAGLWGGLAPWVMPLCFVLNILAGFTLSSLALGLSGLLGRSMSAYLASGALLCLWGMAMPIIGMLSLGILDNGNVAKAETKALFCGFLLHHPLAPQVWLAMRGCGSTETFTDWGLWVPLYGVGIWGLLTLLGFKLAVRGLQREVY